MQSLHNFQNNLNPTSFPSNNLSYPGASDLTSQLMNMFDPSQLNTILGKRPNSLLNNPSLQPDLLKKIKMSNTNLFNFPLGASGVSNLFLNNTPNLNGLGAFGSSFGLNDNIAQLSQLQQLQSLSLLVNNNNQGSLKNLLPQNMLYSSLNNLNSLKQEVKELPLIQEKAFTVKQEFVKQEDNSSFTESTSQKTLKASKKAAKNQEMVHTDDTASESSETKILKKVISNQNEEEPALTELTKVFPDWDLATIFNFMRSGKAIEVFEKERLVKLENKKNRGKLRREKLEKMKQRKAKKTENLAKKYKNK